MVLLSRFAAFSLMAVSLLFSQPSSAGTDAAAKVGDVYITSHELQREIRKRIPLETSFHSGVNAEKIEQIRTAALELLIERAYKVQYAFDNEIPGAVEVLDKRMQAFLGQYKNPEELTKALGGETLEAYRASLYRQLLAEKAEEIVVNSKVAVTEQMLKDYYVANQKRYFRPLQFKASHVLVQVDPAAGDEAIATRKSRAEALLVRAKSGEDFYNLAYYESDERSRYVGGNLGYFHEGQTVQEFDQAVKSMKPGEVSGLVRTRWGFHIIKLDERNEARQLSYDEVKGQIRETMEKEQRAALYAQWMGELKKRYPVTKSK